MADGQIEHLFITDAMSQPMTAQTALTAFAGKGIEGDRYLTAKGTYSKKPEPGRQVTLVEGEVLDWLRSEHGLIVRPEDCRRNVVTRGIELNPLVGRELMLGPVRILVHRLCQPCHYIEKLLNQPNLYETWWDKGGLRCEILESGTIRVGDSVKAI
jgi:MOSC domain-containing protein YiiM